MTVGIFRHSYLAEPSISLLWLRRTGKREIDIGMIRYKKTAARTIALGNADFQFHHAESIRQVPKRSSQAVPPGQTTVID
jgi:hypothetical protein